MAIPDCRRVPEGSRSFTNAISARLYDVESSLEDGAALHGDSPDEKCGKVTDIALDLHMCSIPILVCGSAAEVGNTLFASHRFLRLSRFLEEF